MGTKALGLVSEEFSSLRILLRDCSRQEHGHIGCRALPSLLLISVPQSMGSHLPAAIQDFTSSLALPSVPRLDGMDCGYPEHY